MANPSLSEAIGLQAKPDLSIARTAMAREEARQAARAKAEAEQRQKDEEEYQKMVKGADIYVDKSKYHNVFIPAVKENYRRTLEAAQKAHMENPHDLARVEEILKNGAYNLNYYKTNSEKLFEQQKDLADRKIYANPQYINQLESGDYSDVFFNDKTGRVESRGWAELAKTANSDPRFNHYFDPSGNVVYNPVKTFDFDAVKKQVLGSEGSYEPTGKVKQTQQIGGQNVFYIKEQVRPDLAYTYAASIIMDPDKLAATRLRYKDDFDKALADKLSGVKTPDNAPLELDATGRLKPGSEETYLTEKLVKDLFTGERDRMEMRAVPSEGGAEDKQQVATSVPPISITIKKKVTQGGQGQVMEFSDNEGKVYRKVGDKYFEILKQPEYRAGKVVSQPVLSDEGIPENQAAAKGINPQGSIVYTESFVKPIQSKTFKGVNIQQSEGIVLNSEGRREPGQKIGFNGIIDGVHLMEWYKDKNGNPALVTDEDREELNKKGVPIAKGWFAVGREVPKGLEGEKESERVFIPLSQGLQTRLQQSKLNINIPESDLWRPMSSFGGQKSVAPAAKKVGGGFQTFTVKGKTYNIPDSEVDEFKKEMGLQ